MKNTDIQNNEIKELNLRLNFDFLYYLIIIDWHVKVKLSDYLLNNKIYEELTKGKYQLAIWEEEIYYNKTDFEGVKQVNKISNIITEKLLPLNCKDSNVLPKNPKDLKIFIDYWNNNILYWIEPSTIFDINDYKYEALNYEM